MFSPSFAAFRSLLMQVFTPCRRYHRTPVALSIKRTLVTLMMLAMLLNQAIASPLALEALIGNGADLHQELSFRWHTGGWAKLWQQGLGNAAVKPETQADRDARVFKIKISPEEVTAKPGETVILSGIATDYDGNSITGVKFDWSANDEGRKEPAHITPQGEFTSPIPGNFKVTAYALGRQASLMINVIGEPFKRRKPEEIPAMVVSSRDLPPAKSDSSLRLNQSSGAQIASLSTQPTSPRKALRVGGKPSFKAATNAFTSAATLQAYGARLAGPT